MEYPPNNSPLGDGGCPLCDATYTLSNKERIQLSASLNILDVVAAAINQLFDDGKIDEATKKELFQSHYAPLKKAVNEGFQNPPSGGRGAGIEYGTPNYEFLKQLQTNTAVFAMFKSHASIQDMVGLLKDESGNLRTKADFIKQAKQLDSTYRTQYLDVEYDTAVRTARLASQWAKFEKNKRLYPNLRYLLSKAAKPDQKHLAFVGIIRPVNDSFWDTHYPPNRWRCQCGVEQTDADATDIPDNLPPVAEAFRFNAGKQGQIFDLKNSEYIKKVPPKEQPALIRQAEKIVNTQAAKDATYQPMYQSKSGGNVSAHPLAFDNTDFKEVLSGARAVANAGSDVKLLPDIGNPDLRKTLTPAGAKGAKNPDYLINDKVVADLKTLQESTKKAVHGAISRCFKQCNNLVLRVPESNTITAADLNRYVKGKLSHAGFAMMDKIWIDWHGKLYETSRHQIVQLGEWNLK